MYDTLLHQARARLVIRLRELKREEKRYGTARDSAAVADISTAIKLIEDVTCYTESIDFEVRHEERLHEERLQKGAK
jgi:hypothetical protein